MKEIKINENTYALNYNAFSYTLHKNTFKNGIFKDINVVRSFFLEQLALAQEDAKLETPDVLDENMSNFIISIAKLAYTGILTADKSFMSYEKWLETFIPKLSDSWIVEVAEYAVECFC